MVVLEDTSELLRAQKAAAWHEVARRVAHEIKNPLTPDRPFRRTHCAPGGPAEAAPRRPAASCASAPPPFRKSVESVKTLVDEFSHFARFPAAQPVRSDFNEVVREALDVFSGPPGRHRASRPASRPACRPSIVDREQFKRVVVNLVDNAAEAMQDSLVKKLLIGTQPGAADTRRAGRLPIRAAASARTKRKGSFCPISRPRIAAPVWVSPSSAISWPNTMRQIRVEDNQPAGARFTVEIPALIDAESPEGAARPSAVQSMKAAQDSGGRR